MGAAAEHRGNAAIRATIDAETKAVRNTLDARTAIWGDIIQTGQVLTWKHPRGGVMSLGPYQTATGDRFRRFALLSKHGDQFFSEAWPAAIAATSFVGRQLPREAK